MYRKYDLNLQADDTSSNKNELDQLDMPMAQDLQFKKTLTVNVVDCHLVNGKKAGRAPK